jgi:hypothetical protein
MSNDKSNEARVLTPEVVSRLYSIPKGSLANWRTQSTGPKWYKRGRRIFYRREDIESWLFSEPHLTKDSLDR